MTHKGNGSITARTKVMPERLSDGFPIATYFAVYLTIAPQEGPLFQLVNPTGQWSGKPWKADTMSSHIRRALVSPNLCYQWPEDQAKKFTAHCFRTTAGTDMASQKVHEGVTTRALNHKPKGVTDTNYVIPSREVIRNSLAETSDDKAWK